MRLGVKFLKLNPISLSQFFFLRKVKKFIISERKELHSRCYIPSQVAVDGHVYKVLEKNFARVPLKI